MVAVTPYARVCYECLSDFETGDSEDELCPACHRQYLRENCPEALAEWDDRWEEGVILPAEPIGNLCPECDCHGSIVIYHSALRDWETGEYTDSEEVVCAACDGLGFLTRPADVAARSR